jgi:phage terminase small subunit
MEELKPLSKKHQKVQDEYVTCFNQTRAYQSAYPDASYESARTAAARLFANDNFLAHLKARLDEVHMSADEALKLTADIARGDIAEFLAVSSMGFTVDIAAAHEAGKTRLIKKIKQKTITINGKNEDREIHTEEIELYDAQAAVRDVLKLHGKFTDKLDVTSGGKPLSWKNFIDDTNAESSSK